MTHPRATISIVNGQPVIDDPDARNVIKAIAKHNCRATLELHRDRVRHFVGRMSLNGRSPDDVVIVLLNVDDPEGYALAEVLMPGQDAVWQSMRDKGQVPFARGLAMRHGIQELVSALDSDEGQKLYALAGKPALVVMDHGVVAVFDPIAERLAP